MDLTFDFNQWQEAAHTEQLNLTTDIVQAFQNSLQAYSQAQDPLEQAITYEAVRTAFLALVKATHNAYYRKLAILVKLNPIFKLFPLLQTFADALYQEQTALKTRLQMALDARVINAYIDTIDKPFDSSLDGDTAQLEKKSALQEELVVQIVGDKIGVIPAQSPFPIAEQLKRPGFLNAAHNFAYNLVQHVTPLLLSTINSVQQAMQFTHSRDELKYHQAALNHLARFKAATNKALGWPWRLLSRQNAFLKAYRAPILTLETKYSEYLTQRYEDLLNQVIDKLSSAYPQTYTQLLKQDTEFYRNVNMLNFLKLQVKPNPSLEARWQGLRLNLQPAFHPRQLMMLSKDLLLSALKRDSQLLSGKQKRAIKAVLALLQNAEMRGDMNCLLNPYNSAEQTLIVKQLAKHCVMHSLSSDFESLKAKQPAIAHAIEQQDEQTLVSFISAESPCLKSVFQHLKNWLEDAPASQTNAQQARLDTLYGKILSTLKPRFASKNDPLFLTLRDNDALRWQLKRDLATLPKTPTREALEQMLSESASYSLTIESTAPAKKPSSLSLGYDLMQSMLLNLSLNQHTSNDLLFTRKQLQGLQQDSENAPLKLKILRKALADHDIRLSQKTVLTAADKAILVRIPILMAFLEDPKRIDLQTLPRNTSAEDCLHFLAKHAVKATGPQLH